MQAVHVVRGPQRLLGSRGLRTAAVAAAMALSVAACGEDEPAAEGGGGGAATSAKGQSYALVLHLRIPFTRQIEQGAKDAAAAAGAKLTVVGPTNLDPPTEVRDFQNVSTTGVKGIAVAAATPEIWKRPVRSVQDAKVPVTTLNAGSVDIGAESPPYVGVNEVNAGRQLAKLLIKNLPADASGFVTLGNGQPGAPPLEDRTKGFKAEMSEAAPNVKVRGPFNVGQDQSANFSQWRNVINANPKALAHIGITAVDLPNLAKIKTQTKGDYEIASFDLTPESLKAVSDGVAIGTIGQSPYLQGYVPVRLLIDSQTKGLKIPLNSWIDPGTEVVDKTNVAEVIAREDSPEQTKAFYAPKVDAVFGDLAGSAKPLAAQRK